MTTAEHTDHKIFYGWWVVVTAGIGSFMSYGPIIAFTFGVFIKPLSEEFGWSRASVAGVFSLYAVAYSILGLVAGRLADRWGPRVVVAIGGGLLGLGLALALQAISRHHGALHVESVAGRGTTMTAWLPASPER